MFNSQFTKAVKLQYFPKVNFRSLFSAPIKKFYKNVTISQVIPPGEQDLMYEVQLDKRKLRTPGGKTLLIPNETLALAVAVEWDSQKETVKRHSMHLTTLCNRVLDWRPEMELSDMVHSIMQYADTDTICFREREPEDLVNLQNASWDPILHWVSKRYSIQPLLTNSVTGSVMMSEADRDVLTQNLMGNTRWSLVGIQSCVENLKSIFLTLAALDGFCPAVEAAELSQLEQLFQVHRWGEIPSHHDIEMTELKARVSAAVFFVLANQSRRDVKKKLNLRNLT